ncbi:hypothetical protein [Kitasatospora cinereorecta]|uniref:Uncharacterized protein n=1 Tax=Kitasatospora cinereorecta TaxID=285560 RepID=A0ABW0VM65_9ACTN
MTTHEDVYECRYGWTPKAIRKRRSAVVGVGVGVSALVVGAVSGGVLGWVVVALGVLAVVTAGLSVGMTSASVRGGRVALRVDAEGVLLGGYPLRYERGCARVPWNEITAVELWVQATGGMPYVGVHRLTGAPALPSGTENPTAIRAAERAAGRPWELITASRPVHLWQLDTQLLLETIGRHAPNVVITVDPAFPSDG